MPSDAVTVERPASRTAAQIPVLFLVADTGGGHRAAAQAVREALDYRYPGGFEPVVCDPLGGPRSRRMLRWVAGSYGPLIRWAPWLWGALYHGSDSRPMVGLLRRTLLKLAFRPVAECVARHQPAAVVSFHPLTVKAAVDAGRNGVRGTPVVTVVTDLVTAHAAWRYNKVDRIIAPSASVRRRCRRDGTAAERCVEIGLPVRVDFWCKLSDRAALVALRRSLGLDDRFVVVLVGGGEGTGGVGRQAAAILRQLGDVDVVAICGRNRRLQRKLTRLAGRVPGRPGRLIVKGFVDNMSDWMRCADVVVTKAGPGTVAEATACGAPLLLTSHLPGQEKGNAEFVVDAGAGRRVRSVRRLVDEVDRLRQDPAEVEAMRAASAELGRPDAAAGIADMLADLVGYAPPAAPPAARTDAAAGPAASLEQAKP